MFFRKMAEAVGFTVRTAHCMGRLITFACPTSHPASSLLSLAEAVGFPDFIGITELFVTTRLTSHPTCLARLRHRRTFAEAVGFEPTEP